MDKTIITQIKSTFKNQDEEFWSLLKHSVIHSISIDELILLSGYKKKAENQQEFPSPAYLENKLRVAVIGGYTFHPLCDCLSLLLFSNNIEIELFTGEYDNYIAEIASETSLLHQFSPELVVLIPSGRKCKYMGPINDNRELQEKQAQSHVEELLRLCRKMHSDFNASIILSNYILPSDFDYGNFRNRTLGHEWSFKKFVNLQLGLKAPETVQICDSEFLSCRMGTSDSRDNRLWYESKQMGSMDFIFDLSKEIAHIILSLKKPSKKVLVLDLDNTLWGGVLGDDGLQGIELGDTSPRGEAFKDFQKYILTLKDKGILLAVCSKNENSIVDEVFTSHPEMVLKREDFVQLEINWDSKADNIFEISKNLNLGLDSIVFVDDNPAEIEIVDQFLPDVTTVLLSDDPSNHADQLKNTRLFELIQITEEDRERTKLYQTENKRAGLRKNITDMHQYLKTLEMKAEITEFNNIDLTRICQLINKSNQFNLTTKRRSESELLDVMKNKNYHHFSIRLQDKFGDYGLIGLVICVANGRTLEIDTFLMSCRVLERKVEFEIVNKMVSIAKKLNLTEILGVFIPTKKNGLVKNLYQKLGFKMRNKNDEHAEYELKTNDFKIFNTEINVST